MKTKKFKCTLLSDVILNQKAATEGPNKTLDFIPGSCFLGIVANKLYPKEEEYANKKEEYGKRMELAMEIFHSGKVRFGDAHPSIDSIRGLKIPASMFYPKLKKASEECYIHHAIPDELSDSDDFKKKQLKQCRSGFYVFADNKATEVKTETNFAIKSAYDKNKRRSEDEKMYGYESLQKGREFFFEVEVEDESLLESIAQALKGEKRVGRSRTAQYGLVNIEEQDYADVESCTKKEDYVTVYADGRLIFLDEYGLPTFRPSAKDLGIDDGEILWEKSQIRTFQYAPWNYTRQCFDADRCGIEKGSVFVVKTSQKEFKSQYVGSYNNEGFGKVIYNPAFLKADLKGLAKYKPAKDEKPDSENPADEKRRKEIVRNEIKELKTGKGLLYYLGCKKEEEELESNVYEMVNVWVENNHGKFKGESFASQWGAIRSIAMTHHTKAALKFELFDKTRVVERKNKKGEMEGKELPDAYLTHGVAADRWNERGRKKAFEEFFNQLADDNAQLAIINLAAEMAKKCKENR